MRNFDTLYADRNISAWGIPAPAATAAAFGEFRGLLLNWADLKDPTAAGQSPPLRIVCSDVLRLPRSVLIDRPTFIFARRIELAGKTEISVDRIKAADLPLLIVVQDIANPNGGGGTETPPPSIATTTVSGADGQTVVDDTISIPAPGSRGPRAAYAFQLGADGKFARVRVAAAATELLADGSPLALAIGVQFQVATLLFTEDRPLAQALLSWVADIAGGSDRFAGMAAEARSLLGRLDAMALLDADAMLVPRLDYALYAQNAQAMVATLNDRWNAVTAIRTAAEDDQRWIDAVQTTIAEKSSDTDLAISLEREAEAAQSNVAAARMIAARDVREESAKLAALRIKFELGIQRWKDEETLKEALNIAFSIVEIVMELPAVVVAGPEILALPAAKSAKGLFEGMVDIAKSASHYLTAPRSIPSDGSGGRVRLADHPRAAPVNTGSGTSNAANPIVLDYDDDEDSWDDDFGFSDDDDDDDGVIRVTRLPDDDSDDDGIGVGNIDGSSGSEPDDFLGFGSFREVRGTGRGTLDTDVDVDGVHFVIVDPGRKPRNANGGIVLHGLSADIERDFVLVDPSDEAAAYAETYNQQVKARKKQEKIRKANDARLEKIQKELFSAGKNIAKSAKGIFDAAMRINKIAKTAESLEADSRKTLARVELVTDSSFGSIAPRGIDVVTGGAQAWDDLESEINRGFTDMGDLTSKISGADDFRYAILRLIRRGRTMSEARLALARANADLAAARLRRRAAERVATLYKERLAKLDDSAKRRQAVEQLAFGRVLDAKRAAWTAMEAYDRAVFYYDLTPRGRDEGAPPITAAVNVFVERARKMGQRWITSERLVRPPQPFTVTHTLTATQLGSPVMLSQGLVNFDVLPDHVAFRGFYRCRLGELEIRVVGLDRNDPIMVDIQTSGMYKDRLATGAAARFVSDPYKIAYVYEPATGKVITPATIVPRVAEDYFKPTPFTGWQLSFRDPASQEPLKLDGLTAVNVVFKGEWCRA